MEKFVEYLVKNLVDDPDQVQVQSRTEADRVIIEFRVAQKDVGRVIGGKGRTIQALRTLVMTAGARLGIRVQLELIEEEAPTTAQPGE